MIRTTLAAAAAFLAATAAHAQDCGTAMPAFRAALDANTAEAVAGFIEAHPGCFTAPAQAKLAALGGAPEGGGATGYDGPPIQFSVLTAADFFGARAIEAETEFWTRTLPNAGAFAAELTPGYAGASPLELGAMLAAGEADAALLTSNALYSMDGPFSDVMGGLDVPFAVASAAEGRRLLDAVRPSTERAFEEAGLVLLAVAPLLPRILICDGDVDLSGMRVRASGTRGLGYEGLGATTVRLAFGEIQIGFDRDIIDCVDLAAAPAMRAGLHRTGRAVAPAPVSGLGIVALAMGADAWNEMPEAARDALSRAAREDFEAPAWDGFEAARQADLDCMTGRGSCPAGVEPGNSTLLPALNVAETDRQRLLEEVVLRAWADAGGGALVDAWRDAARAAR